MQAFCQRSLYLIPCIAEAMGQRTGKQLALAVMEKGCRARVEPEDQTGGEGLPASSLSRCLCCECFLSVCDLSFHFLHRVFGRAKVLNFDEVQFICFMICTFVP